MLAESILSQRAIGRRLTWRWTAVSPLFITSSLAQAKCRGRLWLSWTECQRCDCWQIKIFSDPQPGVIRHKKRHLPFIVPSFIFLYFFLQLLELFGSLRLLILERHAGMFLFYMEPWWPYSMPARLANSKVLFDALIIQFFKIIPHFDFGKV